MKTLFIFFLLLILLHWFLPFYLLFLKHSPGPGVGIWTVGLGHGIGEFGGLSPFSFAFFFWTGVCTLYLLALSTRGFCYARFSAFLKVLYVGLCECMVEITYRFVDGECASDQW